MRYILFVASLLTASISYADGDPRRKDTLPAFFEQEMLKAQKEYQDQSSVLLAQKKHVGEKSLSELTQELTERVGNKSQDALVSLAAQVDALKSQAIVEKASLLATQSPQ